MKTSTNYITVSTDLSNVEYPLLLSGAVKAAHALNKADAVNGRYSREIASRLMNDSYTSISLYPTKHKGNKAEETRYNKFEADVRTAVTNVLNKSDKQLYDRLRTAKRIDSKFIKKHSDKNDPLHLTTIQYERIKEIRAIVGKDIGDIIRNVRSVIIAYEAEANPKTKAPQQPTAPTEQTTAPTPTEPAVMDETAAISILANLIKRLEKQGITCASGALNVAMLELQNHKGQ